MKQSFTHVSFRFNSGAFVLAGGDNGNITIGGGTFVSANANGGTGGNEYSSGQMLEPVKPGTTFTPSRAAARAVGRFGIENL